MRPTYFVRVTRVSERANEHDDEHNDDATTLFGVDMLGV